jgi:hypothetical protein
MATWKTEDSVSKAYPKATPDTISDVAAQADLGPLDDKTAMMVRLCEERIEKKYLQHVAELRVRIASTEEKYVAALRELRDTLRSIKFDDFLKVIIGILAGIIVLALRQQGIQAFTDFWVAFSSVAFIIVLTFIVIRYLGPSVRRREVKEELKSLKDKGQQ